MTHLVCAVFLVTSLFACSKHSEPPPPSPSPSTAPAPTAAPSPAEEASSTFKTVCAACHGVDGKGDGIAAASLNPKPRNYTDKAWQQSVTDEHIRDIILKGGQAMGKSPMMPAQPQLASKPEVVNELVKIVRSFGA